MIIFRVDVLWVVLLRRMVSRMRCILVLLITVTVPRRYRIQLLVKMARIPLSMRVTLRLRFLVAPLWTILVILRRGSTKGRIIRRLVCSVMVRCKSLRIDLRTPPTGSLPMLRMSFAVSGDIRGSVWILLCRKINGRLHVCLRALVSALWRTLPVTLITLWVVPLIWRLANLIGVLTLTCCRCLRTFKGAGLLPVGLMVGTGRYLGKIGV